MPKQEKIPTGETDFEIQERGKNELDEITRDFLENADPDEIRVREIEQEELQEFLEQATTEEKKYMESLIRLKGIQYKDWTEQGFPMKTTKTIEERPMKNKSDTDIKRSKMVGVEKKVPANLFAIDKNDIKMMEILSDPDKLDELSAKEIKDFEKWQEKYEGFAISDEQEAEVQKFINAHEKISENKAIEIQNLVTRAFPEFYCLQRPWKKKEQKEDIDLSQFKPEKDYAA